MKRLNFSVHPRRLSWTALTTLLVLACAEPLLGGCTFGQAPEPTPIPLLLTPYMGAGGAAQGSARPVYIVQRGDVRDDMSFSAEVALDRREDLSFGTSGRVQTIYVQSGERVKLDQIIAVLDTRVLELDRQAAVATLDLAQQRLALAEAQLRFDRLKRQLALQAERLQLAQLQADPQAEELAVTLQELVVRQAELSLQQLESGVEPGLAADVTRAEIALRKVQTALADAEISAPFAGQVLLYDALAEGKVVAAYAPVAAIVDPDALVLEANLVPADLQSLHEGMSVTIAAAGDPSASLAQPLIGVIRTLPQPFGTGAGPKTVIVPQDTHTAQASFGSLRPGATVKITVARAAAQGVLWVPPAAIQGYQDNYFVQLRDGTERAIRVGIFAADRVEIAGGLAFGEEVLGN